ncbi:MAG TPA: CBM35 domain-containing protein [Natronosporangium sp.]
MASGQESVQQLVVHLDERTGAFRGAANGTLYGLSDDGVPSDNVLEPLRISNVAQKPPAGAQHPNGDALVIADSFFRTGGDYVQIYVQDMYAQWTYEDLGFEDYLQKLAWVVDQVSQSRYADRIVYVPFNEPDFIWYGLGTDNQALYQQRMAVFLEHWQTAVEYIRAHHPGARIAGPNDAQFRARNYGDFLTFGRDHGVLPDIVTWHQLPSSSLDPASSNYFRNNYAVYRELERERGIDPIPININEYGGNRDLTVPGQLVQWVAMLEEAKVDAGGKAYWTAAGGLAGDVVQTNRPGGGWWFYKMYADLAGGDTVAITRPDTTSLDALDAIAVVDDHRRQARIVAGGTAEPFDVVIEGIDPARFGGSVHVRLAATTWSGQNTDAPPPTVLLEDDFTPVGGTLTVPVRGLGVAGDGGVNVDRMAAYEIVLSPGGNGTRQPVELPWRASYEAEHATITAGTVFTQGTPQNWNGAATSGDRDVGALNQPESAVTFEVEVPQAGDYRLGIMYGNQTGQPSQQILTVNGGQAQFVDYEATMSWVWRTRKDVVVRLEAGTNQIRLATSHPEFGRAVGEATLDRIDLELLTGDAPVTRHYEAELAQSAGPVTYGYDQPQQSGAGYVTIQRGGEVLFAVYAEEDGYYDLEFRHHSPGRPGSTVGQISLDRRDVEGATLTAAPGNPYWRTDTHRLFLSAGINRVVVTPTGPTPIRLDRVSVTRATSGSQPVLAIEAEDAQLAGTAAIESHGYASGGRYVGWVGQGPENRVALEVDVPRAGDYLLVVHYANDERDVGHPYNTDIISRPVDVSVNGGEPVRYWFKNTWSWGNWWARGVPVTLQAGVNTIALFNDPANAARADGCPEPCLPVLDSEWAPNFDRFELAPIRVP